MKPSAQPSNLAVTPNGVPELASLFGLGSFAAVATLRRSSRREAG